MTINEFNKKYYFHDSILDKIEYEHKKLKMYCTFCDFMQKAHNENDYTNSDIIVVFNNASYEITDNFHVEASEFIEQELRNNTISFFMGKDFNNNYGYLKIQAESVDVIKIRSYNL